MFFYPTTSIKMASLQGAPSPDGQCQHWAWILPARLLWLHDLLSLWTQLNATALSPNLSLPSSNCCSGWSYPIIPDSSLPAEVSKPFSLKPSSVAATRPWLSILVSNYPWTNLPTLSQPINCHQENHIRLPTLCVMLLLKNFTWLPITLESKLQISIQGSQQTGTFPPFS